MIAWIKTWLARHGPRSIELPSCAYTTGVQRHYGQRFFTTLHRRDGKPVHYKLTQTPCPCCRPWLRSNN